MQVPAAQVERARLLRWYGLDRMKDATFRCSQSIEEVGYKYHMNDLSAAIGLGNMTAAITAVKQHRANAIYYHEALAGISRVTLPKPNQFSSWWLYTLLVDDRDSFIQWMHKAGIMTSPVHARNDRHPAFYAASLSLFSTPGLDYFADHEVAIPVGWWLTDTERENIADQVRKWSKS
jgi:dTDP-4-amino-4,6-dideoxygalactose transaminase